VKRGRTIAKGGPRQPGSVLLGGLRRGPPSADGSSGPSSKFLTVGGVQVRASRLGAAYVKELRTRSLAAGDFRVEPVGVVVVGVAGCVEA